MGSSGAILSYIMCKAMNRSFISVILGGFGQTSSSSAAAGADQSVQETNSEEVCEELRNAQSVIIVPGYGMAVAQAQNGVSEMTKLLRDKGRERALWHSPGRRPPARAHERTAGRGPRAL